MSGGITQKKPVLKLSSLVPRWNESCTQI